MGKERRELENKRKQNVIDRMTADVGELASSINEFFNSGEKEENFIFEADLLNFYAKNSGHSYDLANWIFDQARCFNGFRQEFKGDVDGFITGNAMNTVSALNKWINKGCPSDYFTSVKKMWEDALNKKNMDSEEFFKKIGVL